MLAVNRRKYLILSEAGRVAARNFQSGRGGSSKALPYPYSMTILIVLQSYSASASRSWMIDASSHFRTTLVSYANEMTLLKKLLYVEG